MKRRNFLQKSSLVASLGFFGSDVLGNSKLLSDSDKLKPILLNPLPPLMHQLIHH